MKKVRFMRKIYRLLMNNLVNIMEREESLLFMKYYINYYNFLKKRV